MLLASGFGDGVVLGVAVMLLLGLLAAGGVAIFFAWLNDCRKDPRTRRRWLEAKIEDLYEKLASLEEDLKQTRELEPPLQFPERKDEGPTLTVEVHRSIDIHKRPEAVEA